MILQNVSRKTHILSFLRRKQSDPAITLTSGQAIDLATKGYKDEELNSNPQIQMLLQSGEIKALTTMPPVTPAMVHQAEQANTALERERIIEFVKNHFAVTLIEYHRDKARDTKDFELETICKDRLSEIGYR